MDSIFDGRRYDESVRADQGEISRFREAHADPEDATLEDPRPRIVQRHLRLYLDEHPAPRACVSLAFAFDQWRRLDGAYEEMSRFLDKIRVDEGQELENPWDQARLWDDVGGAMIGSSQRDGRRKEGLKTLEEFARSRTTEIGSAFLLFMIAREWIREDDTEAACRISEQILQIDTRDCPFYVERTARGCIQEHHSLHLGSAAPTFKVRDLEGKSIDLAEMRDKTVLLHFWSTTCPFCADELEFVEAAHKKHSDRLQVIGIAMDQELEPVVSHIESKPSEWPQIHDRDWELVILYNVLGVPSNYVVDRDGKLAGKRIREHEVDRVITSTTDN